MDISKLMSLEAVREMFAESGAGGVKEDTRLLLESMEEVRFRPGQDIVTCGRPGDDGMYILLEGTAQVLDGGGRQINTPLERGSIIGEMALLRGEPRGATVRAVTEAACARLTKDQFERAAEINRKLYGALLDLAYRRTTGLVQEQARLRSELEIAARIQNGLLRRDFTDTERLMGLRIAALMEPAKEVGGDFYDVFQISEKKCCFVIADVSGKGVPAALFMAMAKIHIKNYGMLDMSLEELAFRVNNQLCRDNPEEMFVTAFIGVLDGDTGMLTFINAGHNRPYIAFRGAVFVRLPCHSDLVFGLWEDRKYTEERLDLRQVESLFFYTDGVTEAENRAEEQFGDNGLKASLNRVKDRGNPGSVVGSLFQDLKQFADGADQSDDITMLNVWTGGISGVSGGDALEKTVPARMEYMEELIRDVDRYMADRGCAGIPGKIEIALEEIFTNIASYAYGKEAGELSLNCLVERGTGNLLLRFKDRGKPFNPLTREDPDLTLALEERPVGGLGIYMVKQFVDEADYEYRDGFNILTLRKRIAPQT